MGSLQNAGADLKGGSPVQFHVTRLGSDAELKPRIADEIFYVAREALTNAFRHSTAAEISLTLDYGRRYFSLRCRDNGRGFSAAKRDKRGHWGLKGMAERAQAMQGMFRCRSEPGEGTDILVALPAYRAYQGGSRLLFYWRALYVFDL
jgi:signal transduction histidine kinase